MAEWLKAVVSKTAIGGTLSRVRIPLSPYPFRFFQIEVLKVSYYFEKGFLLLEYKK